MATRHTGHSFFVSSAVRMQSLQYVWPQGVVTGLVSWSQQMGQRSAASERPALERVIKGPGPRAGVYFVFYLVMCHI